MNTNQVVWWVCAHARSSPNSSTIGELFETQTGKAETHVRRTTSQDAALAHTPKLPLQLEYVEATEKKKPNILMALSQIRALPFHIYSLLSPLLPLTINCRRHRRQGASTSSSRFLRACGCLMRMRIRPLSLFKTTCERDIKQCQNY